MLTYALTLALAVHGRQVPAGPLSPADLPPPPVAPSVSQLTPERPQPQIHIGVHSWVATESVDVATRRLLRAFAKTAKVSFAEIGADGHIRGYGPDYRVATVINDVQVFVIVVGRRKSDGDEFRKLIEANLAPPDLDPQAPTRFGKPDPSLDKQLPQLDWHSEVRPADPIAGKYFRTVAELALERRGFQLQHSTTPAAPIVYAERSGGKPDYQYVTMGSLTPPGKKTCYLIVSSWIGRSPPHTALPICTSIVNALHE